MRTKTSNKVYLAFLFCGILSSCSYRTDAQNPLRLAPKNHQSTATVEKKTVRKTEERCGEGFLTKLPQQKEILCLSEVIDLGLRNNPNTRITWAEARQAASIYGQSLADFFPEINLVGSYQRVRETLQEGNLFLEYQQTTVTPEMQANYIIFDFGQRRNASSSALFSLYYANYSHNREIESVLQLLINDYFDYLYQKDLLKADEANLMSAQATLDAANERKNTGVVSMTDVVQAKTQYLQSKISFIGQEVDLKSSYAILARDMGIPANFSFRTDKLPDEINVNIPIQPLSVLIDSAKRHRQDYLAIKANKQSKVFSVQSAEALQRPTLSATFDFGRDYYGSFSNKEDYHYTAQLSLEYSLFNGYYYSNLIKQTKADLEEANAQVNQVELNIFEQVTTAQFNLKKAKEAYAVANEYLNTAKTRFKIALASYKAGTETILDVLSAQSSLADARAEVSNAKKTWYLSLANLAYATGTLTKHTLIPEEKL